MSFSKVRQDIANDLAEIRSAGLWKTERYINSDQKNIIILEDGSETTLHVANTGAMSGCATPNDNIWYSTSDNPKRKYAFSWELTHTASDDFICVNTLRANQLAEEALNNGIIKVGDLIKV